MKNFAKFFMFSLALATLTVSCNSDATKKTAEKAGASIAKTETTTITRGGNALASKTEQFKLLTSNLQKAETFSLKSLSAAQLENLNEALKLEQNDDEDAPQKLFSQLMSAEKDAQALDVEFSMSDEPVENGVFIFKIKGNVEDLELEMMDEEMNALAANTRVSVTNGDNYKALNVSSLESGTYVFRLSSPNGEQLVRTVEIINDDVE